MNTTRIVKAVSSSSFKGILEKYEKNIATSSHALDHLSDMQRKIFDEQQLLKVLLSEEPEGVGIQKNGNYSAYYRRKRGYLRIIFNTSESKLEIVTFINTATMPNLGKLEYENGN